MSIINEALKKTQIHLKEKTAVTTDDRLSWPPPITQERPVPARSPEVLRQKPGRAETKRTTKKWHLIVFLEIVLFLIAAGVIFVLQPRLFHASVAGPTPAKSRIMSAPRTAVPPFLTKSVVPTATVTSSSSANLAINPSPTSGGPKHVDLVLNGIMMNGDKLVALINNEIYELGDKVDGRKITKITLDQVELRDGDELTILNVRQRKDWQ